MQFDPIMLAEMEVLLLPAVSSSSVSSILKLVQALKAVSVYLADLTDHCTAELATSLRKSTESLELSADACAHLCRSFTKSGVALDLCHPKLIIALLESALVRSEILSVSGMRDLLAAVVKIGLVNDPPMRGRVFVAMETNPFVLPPLSHPDLVPYLTSFSRLLVALRFAPEHWMSVMAASASSLILMSHQTGSESSSVTMAIVSCARCLSQLQHNPSDPFFRLLTEWLDKRATDGLLFAPETSSVPVLQVHRPQSAKTQLGTSSSLIPLLACTLANRQPDVAWQQFTQVPSSAIDRLSSKDDRDMISSALGMSHSPLPSPGRSSADHSLETTDANTSNRLASSGHNRLAPSVHNAVSWMSVELREKVHVTGEDISISGIPAQAFIVADHHNGALLPIPTFLRYQTRFMQVDAAAKAPRTASPSHHCLRSQPATSFPNTSTLAHTSRRIFHSLSHPRLSHSSLELFDAIQAVRSTSTTALGQDHSTSAVPMSSTSSERESSNRPAGLSPSELPWSSVRASQPLHSILRRLPVDDHAAATSAPLTPANDPRLKNAAFNFSVDVASFCRHTKDSVFADGRLASHQRLVYRL